MSDPRPGVSNPADPNPLDICGCREVSAPLQEGESIVATCDACTHPVIAHQQSGCIVSAELLAWPQHSLPERALRACIDQADISRDSAIPRDWWLRATAMDLIPTVFGEQAASIPITIKRMERIMRIIETGE